MYTIVTGVQQRVKQIKKFSFCLSGLLQFLGKNFIIEDRNLKVSI